MDHRVRYLVLAGARLAAFLMTFLAISASPLPALAQFGLGNLLNTGKDVAVQAALSAFGKSLGAQLPIVVDNGDAYPTVSAPPGLPFKPSASPAIAQALRLSRDGTVALSPGDYEFPVDVFCMRVHAGSPSAYRYVVAPLHGSAADIVTALNARIPSYRIDHHVLQVLSWDIQAGMAYDGMGKDQRAAVDKIIPDFRGRLSGDVYERIHDQYTRVAQNVPGMPSFEDALSRLGTVGTSVLALQKIRQELANPPPTFDALARALVPSLPGTGGAHPALASTSAVPWSRYSTRVYVRFVTAGNYSTPGTYQVRVLPEAATADRPGAASQVPLFTFARYAAGTSDTARGVNVAAALASSVPFTNIVNNPGTDSVQPLTQAPQAGPAAPPPSCSSPLITSETVALTPENRSRTIVGVGEQVQLTFSCGQAIWSFQGSDGHLNTTLGSVIDYSAASTKATETITATGEHDEKATITFDVIPPDGVLQKRDPENPLLHQQYTPSIGFWADTYIAPATVSFQFIQVREVDVCGTASGVFLPPNGKPSGHHPNPTPVPVGAESGALGSELPGHDGNYSGTPNNLSYNRIIGSWHDSFAPGFLMWEIPWVYSLKTGSAEHKFAVVEAKFTLGADRQTLTASKAGASSTDLVDNPSVGPAGTPTDPNALDSCQK
jgi:hypothetical protein